MCSESAKDETLRKPVCLHVSANAECCAESAQADWHCTALQCIVIRCTSDSATSIRHSCLGCATACVARLTVFSQRHVATVRYKVDCIRQYTCGALVAHNNGVQRNAPHRSASWHQCVVCLRCRILVARTMRVVLAELSSIAHAARAECFG